MSEHPLTSSAVIDRDTFEMEREQARPGWKAELESLREQMKKRKEELNHLLAFIEDIFIPMFEKEKLEDHSEDDIECLVMLSNKDFLDRDKPIREAARTRLRHLEEGSTNDDVAWMNHSRKRTKQVLRCLDACERYLDGESGAMKEVWRMCRDGGENRLTDGDFLRYPLRCLELMKEG